MNSRKQDDTELGRLMHDLHCKNAGDIYYKESICSKESNSVKTGDSANVAGLAVAMGAAGVAAATNWNGKDVDKNKKYSLLKVCS